MRGELSVDLLTDRFCARGGRILARPDPIKSFKINRVPWNAHNCSGLASRRKKPATSAGDLVWRGWRGLCQTSVSRGATRRGNLWGCGERSDLALAIILFHLARLHIVVRLF